MRHELSHNSKHAGPWCQKMGCLPFWEQGFSVGLTLHRFHNELSQPNSIAILTYLDLFFVRCMIFHCYRAPNTIEPYREVFHSFVMVGVVLVLALAL